MKKLVLAIALCCSFFCAVSNAI